MSHTHSVSGPSAAHLASSVSSVQSTSSTSSASSVGSADTAYQTSSSRPFSHHRRKSSVSTRRESAEIMGLNIASDGDDEDFGVSTDEVRKRALLALEGRPPVLSGFAKVEIPDWQTPTVDKSFDWDALNGSGLNFGSGSLAGKRDSFGRNLVANAAASQKELGTLLEEDEEEEEQAAATRSDSKRPMSSGVGVPVTQVTKPTPLKQRPASLNMSSLRRLSLVGDLPTPASTPSPRTSTSGIRPLTLLPTPTSMSSASSSSFTKRLSLSMTSSPASPAPLASSNFQMTPSSTPLSIAASRRNSLKMAYYRTPESSTSSPFDSPSPNDSAATGTPRSSISSRASVRSVSYDRPSSPFDFANQVYNAQNHASLLDRIATLEEALAAAHAESASSAGGSSSGELIALVADLKGKRDNLASSLAKLQREVAEQGRAVALSDKRLETARNDAWKEKDRAEGLVIEVERLKASLLRAEVETVKTKGEGERRCKVLENEKRALRAELDEAVRARDIARAELDRGMSSANTMTQARRSFFGTGTASANMSVDSRTSTIVEPNEAPDLSFGGQKARKEDLSAVLEEEDDQSPRASSSDEESNGLGSYENEPTGFDEYIHHANTQDGSDDSGSYDEEEDEEVEAVTAFRIPLQSAVPTTVPPSASPAPSSTPTLMQQQKSDGHERRPSHSRRSSLVVGWRFPKASAPTVSKPARISVTLRKSPFFVSEDDEEEVEYEAPIKSFKTPPRKKNPTRVEITPDLEDGFAANFGGDESFTFGDSSETKPFGERQNKTFNTAVHAPVTPEKQPALREDTMREDFAFPRPKSSVQSVSTNSMNKPVTPGSLVPPASDRTPEYKLASIVPLVPQAPSTTLSSGLPKATTPNSPGSYFSTSTTPSATSSSSFSSARSSWAPSTGPLTPSGRSASNEGDLSFTYVAPAALRAETKASEATNLVSFPMTSPSPSPSVPLSNSTSAPFSVMSTLGSLAASYMPWSPRATRHEENEQQYFPQSTQRPTATLQRSGSGKAQAVNPNVQREKLRTRLLVEGKIKSGNSQTPSSWRPQSP